MKRFTCSTGFGPQDPAELKAVLLAVGACFLFISFLAVADRLRPRDRKHISTTHQAMPVPPVPINNPPLAELPPPPPAPDANDRFRVVPRNFQGIDFQNRSYGHYVFTDGEVLELELINGRFRHSAASSHWFDLNDVVYTDLTGDGNPEAIVLLSHLTCGQSCDGGKNLIYVYSNRGSKEILQYEAGSGLDGCSLKSLTVKNKKLTIDLFGRCPQAYGTSSDPTRRETYDVTRIEYRYNGDYLFAGKKSYLTLPDNYEVSWGVEINISDQTTSAAAALPDKKLPVYRLILSHCA